MALISRALPRATLVAFAFFSSLSLIASQALVHIIRSVTVSQTSLNVAAREVTTIAIGFAQPGTVTVVLVDRDGYPVRTLAKAQPVGTTASFGWDGRDDRGEVVPDEAYSFRIEWHGSRRSDAYFPADEPAPPMQRIDARSYNRRTATLSYVLPRASRVHIQAGTAVPDLVTKQPAGLTMKTVVNREPRAAGTIAEHWTGFDESGAIFIPDLKDFIVAIAATPLPENSVITFGNAAHRFIDTIAHRRGATLFTHREHGSHHSGLPTADDVSPSLKIEPLNAVWLAPEHVWVMSGSDALRLRVSVGGPTAAAFRKHPATVERFIDGRRLGDAARKTSDVLDVPLDSRSDVQRVSVNWNSDWGPVAANTILVRRASGAHQTMPSGR